MSAFVKGNETDMWNNFKAYVLLLKYLNKSSPIPAIKNFLKKILCLQGFFFLKQIKTQHTKFFSFFTKRFPLQCSSSPPRLNCS